MDGEPDTRGGAFPWTRMVPPSRSPLEPTWLLRAALRGDGAAPAVEDVLEQRFDASLAVLTASGTDALRLALEVAFAARAGRRALLPAYSCYSVATAAVGAGAAIGLYDLEPGTLSPDVDSLREAAKEGCAAVVVAHLYGYPADVPAALDIARAAGAVLVEDAAQEAGASLAGRRLGTLAPLSVLSFGRGKGITCGGGGALLVRDAELADFTRAAVRGLLPAGGGWSELGRAAGEWALGRPRLYGLPASLPFLGLGETVYRPPAPPRAMSLRAAALLERALAGGEPWLTARRSRAAVLRAGIEGARGLAAVRPLPNAAPGELRFPFLRAQPVDRPPRALGIQAGYPATLAELPAVRRGLWRRAVEVPGAEALVRGLLTAPTHPIAGADDLAGIVAWMRSQAEETPARARFRTPEESGAPCPEPV